ncbi:MAG TPA: 8-amino-7-oxononanoate synthase, partial [Clostridiales bacterium]|nr:8-amino-7-oxononanoate synthase [Clostridiales bacterium]
ASLGGYMAAKAEVIDFVRHTSRPFIFSASIPPACCASALAALRYLQAHPEIVSRLSALSNYARSGLIERGISIMEAATPIIPIFTYDTYNTLLKAKEIYDAGVYLNPVLPPATAPDACLLRMSCMASFNENLIDEAINMIASKMVDKACVKSL